MRNEGIIMKKNVIKLLSLGLFALLGLSVFAWTSAISLASGANETTDIMGNLQELAQTRTLEKYYQTQGESLEAPLLLAAFYLPNAESFIKTAELNGVEYKTVYLLIGNKNDEIIYSRFVLLICSLAVLGAAIMYVRTRSRHLMK